MFCAKGQPPQIYHWLFMRVSLVCAHVHMYLFCAQPFEMCLRAANIQTHPNVYTYIYVYYMPIETASIRYI